MKENDQSFVRVYVGIGSNLDDPVNQVKNAVRTLMAIDGTYTHQFSSLYKNPPMGMQDQPAYVNAVGAMDTTLTAHGLLDIMQTIELRAGRIRTADRWGPRTLDLDLLIFGKHLINTNRLTVPHPGIDKRPFVLIPLLEIAPSLIVPLLGSVQVLADSLTSGQHDAVVPIGGVE